LRADMEAQADLGAARMGLLQRAAASGSAERRRGGRCPRPAGW
jgi:hypothetical protein